MKRLKIILSVTTIVMTLFILCALTNVNAAYYYPEGYVPISDEEFYVDEIKFDKSANIHYYNMFCNYARMAKNKDESFEITKTRIINGETSTNVLKTVASFDSREATFKVLYNGEEYFNFSIEFSFPNNLFTYYKSKDIDFNDPTDINYQNVERVSISKPETSLKPNYSSQVDINNYLGYEDFILIKTYDVEEIQEIVDSPINLPSRDVLLKRDIELSSGLKIEGKDNISYGGNYNLEEGKTIDKGIYYLKVTTFYNDITYNIVYKITVTDMISELPRIYISSSKQLKTEDIELHIEENNITNYTYDASTYYENFNNPGIYYIKIKYTYDNKSYDAKFPVYVTSNDNQRIKIKDNSLLKLGYNEILNKEEFLDNIDFDYIEVKECDIDFTEYDSNYNVVGNYDICVKIKDIYNILYIQVIRVEVYDNICPNVSLDELAILEYSYTDIIDIERIIKYINVSDISDYSVTYDASNYLNRTNKIGEFNIDVKVEDIYLNSTNYQIVLKIIDNIPPKIITKPIYASKELMLDNNTIKSKLYVLDEIDGIISNNNIVLNDINGYKDNYYIPGTYHFEVIAKDLSLNEAYSSFDIIVGDEIEEEINKIYIDKNNPFTKEEILSYLIEKGYLNSENSYELYSDYFNVDEYDNDTYSLEVVNTIDNNKEYFEIVITDSNIIYDSIVIEEDEKKSNNSSIIIIIIIASIALIVSGILGVFIYKKKH